MPSSQEALQQVASYPSSWLTGDVVSSPVLGVLGLDLGDGLEILGFSRASGRPVVGFPGPPALSFPISTEYVPV